MVEYLKNGKLVTSWQAFLLEMRIPTLYGCLRISYLTTFKRTDSTFKLTNIAFSCGGSPVGALDVEKTKEMFRDLLSIFDTLILPTHASCHVQYILFYLCSFRVVCVSRTRFFNVCDWIWGCFNLNGWFTIVFLLLKTSEINQLLVYSLQPSRSVHVAHVMYVASCNLYVHILFCHLF